VFHFVPKCSTSGTDALTTRIFFQVLHCVAKCRTQCGAYCHPTTSGNASRRFCDTLPHSFFRVQHYSTPDRGRGPWQLLLGRAAPPLAGRICERCPSLQQSSNFKEEPVNLGCDQEVQRPGRGSGHFTGSCSMPNVLYKAPSAANSLFARSLAFRTTTGRGATMAARCLTSNCSSKPKQNSSGD